MNRLGLAALTVALIVSAGCSRQESAWRDTLAADSAAAYEAYLESYPAGAHAAAARARLAGLLEEQEWERTNRFNTPEAYQRYLSAYPEGVHAATARDKLAAFLLPRPLDDPGPVAAAPQPAVGGALLAAAGEAGDWRVQLGAFAAGEAAARRAWQQLAGRHAGLLGTLSPRIDVVERGGKQLWRLQAGPVGEARAREICAALAASGDPCLPLRG